MSNDDRIPTLEAIRALGEAGTAARDEVARRMVALGRAFNEALTTARRP